MPISENRLVVIFIPKCKKCGAQVPAEAWFCPECGKRLNTRTEKIYPIQMPRESPSAVYYIDAVVAILLLIAGILILIIGIDYLGQLKPTPYYTIPASYYVSGYLIIVLGFAGVIYGIKRMIDDIAKGMQPRE